MVKGIILFVIALLLLGYCIFDGVHWDVSKEEKEEQDG